MENYAKIKLLGEGSFGRVYLMREKKHRHRLVCVKEIRTVNMNSKERQSCRMEGEMMKKLHHPNVIRYFGAFESSNHSNKYIVMEYCSGGDLRQFLKISFNSMNENKICYWFIQICLGLEHMHRNKIMHRDIKSQNIFISNAGFLVLGDLGIARDLQQDGFAQTVIGTPVYMSPEVFDEKSYDLRSDIWALGCVLYEMCTGTPPFVATTTPALINNICNGRFTPLSKKFNVRIREVVEQMLNVDPSKRPTLESVLQDPFFHVHLQRYFRDRFSGDKVEASDREAIIAQMMRLGKRSIIDEKSSKRTKDAEAKLNERMLSVVREKEREAQILASLERLKSYRISASSDPGGSGPSIDQIRENQIYSIPKLEGPSKDLTPRQRMESFASDPTAPSRVKVDVPNIKWKDPIQLKRQTIGAASPNKTFSTQKDGFKFLGIPRKGAPLTHKINQFASAVHVCPDVRLLRKKELKNAQDLRNVIKRSPCKEPVIEKQKQLPLELIVSPRAATPKEMDEAILACIGELEEELRILRR